MGDRRRAKHVRQSLNRESAWFFFFKQKTAYEIALVSWARSEKEVTAAKVQAIQFDWGQIVELAGLLARTLQLSITVTDQSAFIASDTGSVEVNWRLLNSF